MKKQRNIDVFNGDADGICALHQLRLVHPRESRLVTGVKRDIKLLRQIQEVSDARVTVLDISLDSNREGLMALLENDNRVLYFDHHYAGEIPDDPRLEAHINTASTVCSAVLVDQYLKGIFRPWAVVAAFGDNLHETARQQAATLKLDESDILQLRELGELINYNAYGEHLDDLHFSPAALYQAIQPFENPLEFIKQSPEFKQLQAGYQQDWQLALKHPPDLVNAGGRLVHLPAEPWSKRVAGIYSNHLAREAPDQAHGLLVDNGDGTFLVSVRAPLQRAQGADDLCRQFSTGGGRKAAAGINRLESDQKERFYSLFERIFTEQA